MHGQRRDLLRRSRVTHSAWDLIPLIVITLSAGLIQIQRTRTKGKSLWSNFVSSDVPFTVHSSFIAVAVSQDPANYQDAPTEGIRRVLEIVTGEKIPRGAILNTDKIGEPLHWGADS